MPEDLVTEEGVDEGSAASTVEDASTGAPDPQGPPGLEHGGAGDDTAAPVELTAPDVAGPGQQLAEGEG